MTADCATRRERVWKWLHRRSPWAAAIFGLVVFAGCSRPTCVQGVFPVPPPSDEALQSVVGAAAVVTANPVAPVDR